MAQALRVASIQAALRIPASAMRRCAVGNQRSRRNALGDPAQGVRIGRRRIAQQVAVAQAAKEVRPVPAPEFGHDPVPQPVKILDAFIGADRQVVASAIRSIARMKGLVQVLDDVQGEAERELLAEDGRVRIAEFAAEHGEGRDRVALRRGADFRVAPSRRHRDVVVGAGLVLPEGRRVRTHPVRPGRCFRKAFIPEQEGDALPGRVWQKGGGDAARDLVSERTPAVSLERQQGQRDGKETDTADGAYRAPAFPPIARGRALACLKVRVVLRQRPGLPRACAINARFYGGAKAV